MKQQRSLASNSAKKRKILLGTLIPIGVVGLTLGIVLSLTLCHKKEETFKYMKWTEAKQYFNVNESGKLTEFKGDNR